MSKLGAVADERELLPNGRTDHVARLERLARQEHGRPELAAWLALPDDIADDSRLVVVLHGVRRNAREYVESWRAWSQRTGRPVLAPWFDPTTWPGARAYNLGNVLDDEGRATPRPLWAFTALADLVARTRRRTGVADPTWDVFGHSAGAQFAHRFALMCPGEALGSVVVAGAGWFTAPDPDLDWPYGSRHPELGIDDDALTAWTRRPLVLMRGELDQERDEHLRTGPEADAQGRTRWERAAFMLAQGHQYDPSCRWELVDVPSVGHSELEMAPHVQQRWDEGP